MARSKKNSIAGAGNNLDRIKFGQSSRKTMMIPEWLRSLRGMQKVFLLVVLSLSGLILLTYAHTVYTQQTWQRKHGQLRKLQNQESQQTVVTEKIKHELATEADDRQSGLVNPDPANMIFIMPTELPKGQVKANQSLSSTSINLSKKPIAY